LAFAFEEVKDQNASLRRMAEIVANGLQNPKTGHLIIRTARAITADVDDRDDEGELQAIYDAVKEGTDKVPGLKNGLRYVSDPRTFDYFSSAAATLRECQAGACAGDCDDHTILVATLALALGFKVGVRAWGPKPGVKRYEHVYPVVALPKHGPWPKNYGGHGMDTTVADAHVGWEPVRGETLTFWIEEG
jgi:hypothetical protein